MCPEGRSAGWHPDRGWVLGMRVEERTGRDTVGNLVSEAGSDLVQSRDECTFVRDSDLDPQYGELDNATRCSFSLGAGEV